MTTLYPTPRTLRWPALAFLPLLLGGCAASPSQQDTATISSEVVRLSPCPALPNCVLSDASNPVHAISPLSINGEPSEAWASLLGHLESDPQYTITEQSEGYIRAEARTRMVGFIDDVEFELRTERDEIAVRSASRVGLFDLGVNRIRIEGVRRALATD